MPSFHQSHQHWWKHFLRAGGMKLRYRRRNWRTEWIKNKKSDTKVQVIPNSTDTTHQSYNILQYSLMHSHAFSLLSTKRWMDKWTDGRIEPWIGCGALKPTADTKRRFSYWFAAIQGNPFRSELWHVTRQWCTIAYKLGHLHHGNKVQK